MTVRLRLSFFTSLVNDPTFLAAVVVGVGRTPLALPLVTGVVLVLVPTLSCGRATGVAVPTEPAAFTMPGRPAGPGAQRCTPGALALRVIVGVALGLLVVLLGWLRLNDPAVRFATVLPSHSITYLEGRLLQDLRPGSSRYRRVVLEAEEVMDRRRWTGSARGRIAIMWSGDEYLPAGPTRVIPVRGDRLLITGLSGVEPWRGDTPVLWVGEDQLRVDPGAATRWSGMRRSLRGALRGRLTRLDPRGGAIVTALLLGERGGLSEDLTRAVREAGASHVLALSGMHLGVLAAILQFVLKRRLSRVLCSLIVTPVLIVYVWIAGWIPSLVRALVLVCVAMVARVRYRVVPMPLLLARTVVVVAILAPGIVGEVGFQLSILALIGIFVIGPAIVDILSGWFPRWFAVYTGITLAAMLATAPLSLTIFGSLYPAGILLAGVLSALVVLQMWVGILFLGLATVPVAGTFLVEVLRWNAVVIEWFATRGRFFPAVHLDPETSGVVLGWVLAGILLWCVIQFARRIRGRREGFGGESQLDF